MLSTLRMLRTQKRQQQRNNISEQYKGAVFAPLTFNIQLTLHKQQDTV
jgi:hypothetical protein